MGDFIYRIVQKESIMSIHKEIENLQKQVTLEKKNGQNPNIEKLASRMLSQDAHEYWFMVRY